MKLFITCNYKERTFNPSSLVILLVILFQHSQLIVSRTVCYKKYDVRRGTCKGRIKGLSSDVTYKDCCKTNSAKAWKPIAGSNTCIKCVNIVDGSWGSWSKFKACSAECDYGIISRERKCDNPIPKHGGKECDGKKTEEGKCYAGKRCPVDGSWSNWSNWSPCSVSCGKGISLRSRSCTSPRPQFGGKDCKGVSEMTKKCVDKDKCPEDGNWSVWLSWSNCDKVCGMGKQTRNRVCDNPRPKFNGKFCVGDISESSLCMISEKCDNIQSGSGSGDSTDGTQIISGSGSGSGSGEESSGKPDDGSGNIKGVTDADVESGDVDDKDILQTTVGPIIIDAISTVAIKDISGSGEDKKGPFIDDEDENGSGSGNVSSGSGDGSATDKDAFFVIKP